MVGVNGLEVERASFNPSVVPILFSSQQHICDRLKCDTRLLLLISLLTGVSEKSM